MLPSWPTGTYVQFGVIAGVSRLVADREPTVKIRPADESILVGINANLSLHYQTAAQGIPQVRARRATQFLRDQKDTVEDLEVGELVVR